MMLIKPGGMFSDARSEESRCLKSNPAGAIVGFSPLVGLVEFGKMGLKKPITTLHTLVAYESVE